MTSNHDVLSAFLDNEIFDPQELRAALDDPAGRELLIDLLALRQLAHPGSTVAVSPVSSAVAGPARRWWVAAALVLAVTGGFLTGRFFSPPSSITAPAATRVVEMPNTAWHDVNAGGGL